MFKEWYTENDFFGSFIKVEEVINKIIKDSIKVNKLSGKKELTNITKRISINYQGKKTMLMFWWENMEKKFWLEIKN